MVRDIAQLFVAGPPVVAHAMGYDITKEDIADLLHEYAAGALYMSEAIAGQSPGIAEDP